MNTHINREGWRVRTVRSNAFRSPRDGSLDRLYLRTCAVYRLLKQGHINKAQAISLADKRIRNYPKHDGYLTGTIEIWLNGPLNRPQ